NETLFGETSVKRGSGFWIIFRSLSKEVFAANLYDLFGFDGPRCHPANAWFAHLHFSGDLRAFRDAVFDQSTQDWRSSHGGSSSSAGRLPAEFTRAGQ